MKILELYAEDFGKLHDRRFVPGAGLTLFEGPNESGKSTLLALIRFLFYGFGREREERDRRLSWRERCAAGRVRFTCGGEEFLLVRHFSLRGGTAHERPSEEVNLTRLPGGERVETDGLSPGEYLTGLPVELFDSSVCVHQSDIDRVGKADVRVAVGSVLFSGEGDFSVEAAQKRLDGLRRELQLNRGRGGKIPESEDALAAVAERLAKAREQAEQLADKQAEERYYAEIVKTRTEAWRAVNAQLTAADLDRQLSAYAAWRAAVDKAAAAEKALTAAEAEIAAQHLPDEAFFRRLDGLMGEYERADVTLTEAAEKARQLHEAKATPQSAETCRAATWIEEQGGPEQVAENYARLRTKQKVNTALTVVFAILAVAAAALSVIVTPFLWIGAGVFGALAIGALLSSFRHKKRAAELWAETGAPAGAKLDVYLTRLLAQNRIGQDEDEALLRVDLALASARERQADLKNEILNAFGAEQPRPDTVENAKALFEQLRAAAAAALEKTSGLRLTRECDDSAAAALARNLPETDEATLRARRAELPPVTEPVEALAARRDALQSELNQAEAYRRAAERDVAALSAVASDPDELAREQVRLTRQLEKARADLAAVNMAMEALTAAGESLRSGVIPQISEAASATFAALTDGAYDGLLVGDGFAVSLDTPNGPRPIDHFSAGCRDAAYLALRLALLKTLSEEKLPLLFDEALSRLDDERAAALMRVLDRYVAEGGQVLLFTCHKRERQMTADRENVTCLSLTE